jgi:hypothetical protein
LIEDNSPALIEFDDTTLCNGRGQRTQERKDIAPVRSIFGWGGIIVFGWDNIMSSSATATASAAKLSLPGFQTSLPLISPKTFDVKLLRTFESSQVINYK